MVKKILLAEDRLTSRVYLSALLQREGWRVTAANQPEQVPVLAKREHPAVVLLHLAPPHDIRALRLLRALDPSPQIPIVALVHDESAGRATAR